MAAVNGLLQTMPPDVAEVLRRPIRDVVEARSGGLLWLGAIVGLWTTGSFIEIPYLTVNAGDLGMLERVAQSCVRIELRVGDVVHPTTRRRQRAAKQ